MPIYLDNSATTQVRQEVIDAMLPYLTQKWGNSSSAHSVGRSAKEGVKRARQQVAELLSCEEDEVYFSPCGTVSNNVAILGRARFAEANNLGRHLITTTIEHPSALGPAKHLEANGWKVTYLPVDREGLITGQQLENAISDETSIISIMWGNNEIGSVQPIRQLAEIARERRIFFHTDAVQMPGKVPIKLDDVPVSSLALSGHKFYAPKGIGILYVRRLNNLMPVSFGGGQEMGLMPGTEAVANIAGIGMAAELAQRDLVDAGNKLTEMQRTIMDVLCTADGVKLTGPRNLDQRIPGHVSLVVPGAQGEALVMRADLRGICVSSGSACHHGIFEPSQVLKAIGLSDHDAIGSLRITAGAFNTVEECKNAAELLVGIIKGLPRLDPGGSELSPAGELQEASTLG